MVATQYSYLPSWISFLVDLDKAAESSRTLLAAVQRALGRRARRDPPAVGGVRREPGVVRFGVQLHSTRGAAHR